MEPANSERKKMGMTASTNNDSSTGGDIDSTSMNNGNNNEQHTVTLESGRVGEGGRKRKRPIESISCSPSSLRQRLPNEHNDVSNPKKIQKVKKQVTFARKESEIRYYDDAYGDVNENLEIHKSSEKKSSCLTKEMTLLSTEHGKARRELRNISKYDLQSAIKYGVKSKARKVKGEQRWMFKYGNITFITDDTCSKEVTSYRDPVSIQGAMITPKMQEDHDTVSQLIQESFHLITTHSIIIIDQSGSMRTSDVFGFRTRSEAAYGTLALDYIAEQLHNRAGDELMIDTVTIIEMNDFPFILYHQVPLDWILFNNLLKRQKEARPKSHGNYNSCLELVHSYISSDLEKCMLLDIDEEDMPAYTVVFLSDGKPSDNKSDDCSRRSVLMTKISWRLSNKITFFCMGIGAAGSEFAELDRIVTVAKEAGACKNSQFVHAGLNTVAMSNAFSSLATSTTATRTKMLSMDDTENSKPVKQFKMRQKGLCSHEVTSTRFTQQILRYKYDPSLEYPWREISFRNSKTTAIEIEDDPFGKGAERLAYRFYEVRRTNDGKWKRVGGLMVAKDSLKVQGEDKDSFHLTFCYVQMKASEFAAQYNKLVAKTPALQPIEEEVRRPPPIVFLKCHIYEYEDGDGDGELRGYLVEDYLRGKYIKYSNNDGFVKEEDEPDQIISLKIGDVKMTDFLHAFSHWVLYSTSGGMLVCDLQGR